KRNYFQHVAYVNAVASAQANELRGGGDVPVFDGQHIGGAARDDTDGLDENQFLFRFFSGDHLVQQRRGLITDALSVERNAGQRRVGEFAEHFVVVHADDRDFIR